ncbi:Gfo/Idh/MocA family protein [Botrimarina hoheduenensis]|uniref:Glucose--fructose oxidoreductase n=1 Tax=Botrimarina hoheduenensis TaxID=2528000 RepID=A0A5C5W838_9BACT|nr:Gfo/Idh/MocA family oxidoreductase [Botrimarina hoheduenensis]TWT46880.1 Glucose--fructose oxidoreductase precursor [Botrimarina hoheduenensis]
MNQQTPSPNGTPHRRTFLKTAATAVAAPYFVPASVFGATAPSNRVNLGMVGLGNQGMLNLKLFLENKDCTVLAVCDVNRGSYGYKEPKDFYGRDPAREMVEKAYAKKAPGGSYKGCDAYTDFREVLSRDDIDAVVLTTPDHWHGVMTIKAAEAGKDIYCEKPLGLTIAEQIAMAESVRKHNRILQTGSHERSNPVIRSACELVRSGAIGKVHRVVTNVGRHNKVGPGPGWEPMPVPDTLDYDLWLGPAPEAPYHKDRCLYNFRFNYDYAGGQVANFGAHSLDIAQWGLGTDDTGPVQVESVYADFLPEGSLFNAATYTHFRLKYASGVVVESMTAEPSVRCLFEGEDGVIRIDNQARNFVTIPGSIKVEAGLTDVPEQYRSNADHHQNFLDCVRSRKEPNAPVEIGHRSATLCHLGNIASRLGGKFGWDPTAQRFTGSRAETANEMLAVKQRGVWTV